MALPYKSLEANPMKSSRLISNYYYYYHRNTTLSLKHRNPPPTTTDSSTHPPLLPGSHVQFSSLSFPCSPIFACVYPKNKIIHSVDHHLITSIRREREFTPMNGQHLTTRHTAYYYSPPINPDPTAMMIIASMTDRVRYR